MTQPEKPHPTVTPQAAAAHAQRRAQPGTAARPRPAPATTPPPHRKIPRKIRVDHRENALGCRHAAESIRSMSVMPDRWIRHMAQTQSMIEPFVETQKREGV